MNELNSSNYKEYMALHDEAGKTLKDAKVLRFCEVLEERTYHYDKIVPELIGKSIRVEMYSLTRDDVGLLRGCYKEVQGIVKDIKYLESIRFILFAGGEVLDPHSGTDIKIEVL